MTKPKYTLSTRRDQCEHHGEFDNHTAERFGESPVLLGCPRCHFDAKHSADEEISNAAWAVQSERELHERLLDAAIPPRFRKATLTSYRTDRHEHQLHALNTCSDYVSRFEENLDVGRSMLLLGTMGTGKTHLGCAVLQQVVRNHWSQGVSGRYVSAAGIIRDVKGSFGKASYTEAEVYDRVCAPSLLVVDEVGVQHGTDFERQVLFEVFNARYEESLPTIAISNLNILELRKCVGDRVVDRFCENQGPVVLFRWDSERVQA